jgi:DNA helicase-2/ATP-dependent DNA helicase PcrA
MSNSDFLLQNLNIAQRQAVSAPLAHTLVLAGAGSGKTRVLIQRMAWLIHTERQSPFQLLAVTFTNKAAKEMQRRLQQVLNIKPQALWVGTFHGIAHRLLRRHYAQAHLPAGFQILDNQEQYNMVRRVLKHTNLDEKEWPPRQVQSHINQQKEGGFYPEQVETGNGYHSQTLLKLYHHYHSLCQQSGLLDFADLLLRAYLLWRDNPELLAQYQQRFAHVLVDEFQDINPMQYRWLKLLAQHNRVFAVGDDDQSIYGWRGADLAHIHRFQQDFQPNQLVKLEQNYRSTGMILAAANGLIAQNRQRLGKNLWTQAGEGAPIYLYQAYNDLDEAGFIADKLQACATQYGGYQHCAVLYRVNAQSRVLEEALLKRNIPYRIYGGLRFYERAEIKDALAYLRLLAHVDDDLAYERVVNFPPRGIGKTTVETVRAHARRHGCSLWQATTALLGNAGLSARAGQALAKFQQLIQNLKQRDLTLDELAQTVIEQTGLIAYYQKKRGEKEEMRLENLAELVRACHQFSAQYEEDLPLLSAFLTHAVLEAGEAGQGTVQGVQLMTLHIAKGLEFPLVFLCGLEENLFPHQLALAELNGLEEERRLCYVGITRAMRQLYLSYAQARCLHGMESHSRPSRFISEIPIGVLEPVHLSSAHQTVYRNHNP